MRAIWYKDWQGQWKKSDLAPTKKNLEWVRKNLALNGQCDVFTA